MADILCGYTADRDETLVAYLYGEIEPSPRAAFEAHITTCERCRLDVSALSEARQQLRHWSAPDFRIEDSRLKSEDSRLKIQDSRLKSEESRFRGVLRAMREIPAWAQVAAAFLVLGVSAGIANLDIRYDRNGVSVRTGWSRQTARVDAPGPNTAEATVVAAPWRADLSALERQLRTEFRAVAPAGTSVAQTARVVGAPAAPSATSAAAEGQLLRRVRTLVEDSERRQQNELALRIAEAFRDVNAQRQADLVRIDRSLGLVQNTTRIDVAKNRELLDYVVQRVSSQK